MTYSRSVQGLFAAFLVVSVSGKAALNRAVPIPDNQLLSDRVQKVFEAGGLQRIKSSEFGEGQLAVSAQSTSCRIWATELTPYGTMATVIARDTQSIGPLRFVYKGVVYNRAPMTAPLLSFYWSRELKRIGLNPPHSPIVAFAASHSCHLTDLPWNEVATLPS